MRSAMPLAGAWQIARFHWIHYLFGAFLLLTGIQMWWFAERQSDLTANPLLRWLRQHMKITDRLHGEHFFVWQDGVCHAMPLCLALLLIEFSDLIFAVDSIPAIFAITGDPFIVLTSNLFAILGLRAMYFLLADMADRFGLLKYGLAAVLVFIGVKMLLIDLYPIPTGFSLAVVATFVAIAIACSLRQERRPMRRRQVAGD